MVLKYMVARPTNARKCSTVYYVSHFKSSAHSIFFSFKMNVFYKIHLQAFDVISIVLYHSGPTSGQVLYFCQDAFVLMRLITRVTSLDTSSLLLKRFPRSGFFNFGNK